MSTEMHNEVEKIKEWANCTPAMVRCLSKAVLKKVTVQRDQVEIRIDRHALRRTILKRSETAEDAGGLGDVLTLDVTAQLRRSGKVQMVLPPPPLNVKQSVPPILLYSIAKACQWHQEILKREIPNQRALAKRIGRTESDVSRLMRLAFIAPDIIEAIREREHGLSLGSCHDQIPMDWKEQRALFGLPHSPQKG